MQGYYKKNKSKMSNYNKIYKKKWFKTRSGKFHLWKMHLKQRYGLDPTMYFRFLERQHYVCALCGKSFNKQRVAVDHDHKTGKVRGLLHQQCNSRLSWVENTPKKILDYLEKNR